MQASCAQAPKRRADPRVVMALAPRPAQRRDIRTRFFTGTRVYNAVLGEFSDRSRAVKSDPVWTAAHVPHLTPNDLATRVAAFRAVEGAHGFTVDAARRSHHSCANRGCANTCPHRKPRTWAPARSTR